MVTYKISPELYAKLKVQANEKEIDVNTYASILIQQGLDQLDYEQALASAKK
jgi:predicted HicB family RNase H-like nuclease